ncbi:MAG: hypothetical protein IIZ35_04900 [Clostridia bacterium]|nr:hypothetical protein [Clostridia bacterium]
MVRKLYKHEALFYLRWFIPIAAACVGIALISKLTMLFPNNQITEIIKSMIISVYISSLFAMIVFGIVIVSLRFFRSMFTHEGYFTHTIPVEPSALLNCKLICGVLFMLVLVAVAGTSVFIMSLGQELAIVLNQIFKGFASAFRNGEGLDVVLLIIEVCLCALFYLLRTILHVYCACSIGQRMKSKIGGAIMWFFILYGIQQGAGTVLELVFLPVLFNDSFSTVTMHIMLSGYALYQFAIALTFYLISRYRIKNRLNLE